MNGLKVTGLGGKVDTVTTSGVTFEISGDIRFKTRTENDPT